jgi:hypothetical protein
VIYFPNKDAINTSVNVTISSYTFTIKLLESSSGTKPCQIQEQISDNSVQFLYLLSGCYTYVDLKNGTQRTDKPKRQDSGRVLNIIYRPFFIGLSFMISNCRGFGFLETYGQLQITTCLIMI